MAEKAILSCMMQYPDQFIRRGLGEGLKPEMFHHHRALFSEIVAFYTAEKSMEITAFVQAVHLKGLLERCGGPAEISGIFTYAAGGGASWSIWMQQLRETFALRLAITSAAKLSESDDSDEAIQQTEITLRSLREAVRGPRRSVGSADSTREFVERLTAAHEAGDIPGRSTGLMQIDAVSGGMKPGEFWVIGGKPSRGKSVLMIQLACEFISRGETVAIFSLEMMRHEIIGRMVSTMGRVHYGTITQPKKANKCDMMGIQRSVSLLADAPFWIDDTANQNTDTILAEAVRLRDANGSMSLVVVDYLQLVRGNRQRGESREEEVARVSGNLKQLAKELNCPVISATQLNESGQSRESRAIEQDADTLLYIVEDGIKVVKLRNGVRNDLLQLYLNGEFQRFQETKPQQEEML